MSQCLVGLAPYEAVCGNGIIDDDEKCDDGNTAVGDGCSDQCVTEEEEEEEEEGEDAD